MGQVKKGRVVKNLPLKNQIAFDIKNNLNNDILQKREIQPYYMLGVML